MTSRVQALITDIRRVEAERDVQRKITDKLTSDLEEKTSRLLASEARLYGVTDQLQQLTESRSLGIRTEALRQARSGLGVDLAQAYRIEQYLAKGVTLPTETPNLTTAMSNGMKAVARLTEALDDSYADSLNTIIEALQWADKLSAQNIVLERENRDLKQKHDEERSRASEKIQRLHAQVEDDKAVIEAQGAKLGLAHREIAALEREVHDQHNEIAEKTNRIASLSAAKKTDELADFQTTDEAKAFNEVYQPSRTDGLSIYDTAHTTWMAARDYYGGNKPVSGEKGSPGADFTD